MKTKEQKIACRACKYEYFAEELGYRTINGKKYVQSYCPTCRSLHRKAANGKSRGWNKIEEHAKPKVMSLLILATLDREAMQAVYRQEYPNDKCTSRSITFMQKKLAGKLKRSAK